MKRLAIPMALVIILLFSVFNAPAAADSCLKAKALFNKSLNCKSVKEELALLRKAGRLCRSPEVLATVFNNMGDAYERMGKPSLAFRYYKKAVKVKNGLAICYFGAASLYLTLGDAYSAYLVYKKGLNYDPGNKDAQRAMGEAKERYQKSIIVYFPFDSARLTPSAKRRLDLFVKGLNHRAAPHLSDHLKDPEGYIIQIQGYTCDLGPRAYNKRLGLKRAKAVMSYLKGRLKGEHAVFRLKSFGEDAPLIREKDRIARRLNRRVEVRWGK